MNQHRLIEELPAGEIERLEVATTVIRWSLCMLPLFLLPLGTRFATAVLPSLIPTILLNMAVLYWRKREPAMLSRFFLMIAVFDIALISTFIVPVHAQMTLYALNGIYVIPTVVATVGRGARGFMVGTVATAVALLVNSVILDYVGTLNHTFRDFLFVDAGYLLLVIFAGSMTYFIQRALRAYHYRSLVDDLTGLFNYAGFQAALREAQAREHRPLSLAIFDIDHFKYFNDRYGHEVGNQVLRVVGERLGRSVPQGAVLARCGGEEFALLLAGCEEEEAQSIAESLRRLFGSEAAVRIDGEPIFIRVSAGVATAATGGAVRALVEAADLALYAAKRKGRDRTESAPHRLNTESTPTEELEPHERSSWGAFISLMRSGIKGGYLLASERPVVEAIFHHVRWIFAGCPLLLLAWGGTHAVPVALLVSLLVGLVVLLGHLVARKPDRWTWTASLFFRLLEIAVAVVGIAGVHYAIQRSVYHGYLTVFILLAGLSMGAWGVVAALGVATVISIGVNVAMLGLIENPLREILVIGYLHIIIFTLAGLYGILMAGLIQEFGRRAISDPLTGLFNQGYFRLRLRELHATAHGSIPAGALLLIDLDNFKQINDTHGHSVGDEVLLQVARGVQALVWDGAEAVRYGGDEFALLLPGANADEARQMADQVRERLRAIAVGREHIDASIGVSLITGQGGADEVVAEADHWLYRAKESGKGQVISGVVQP